MTLITQLTVDSYPLLMGDLLLSADRKQLPEEIINCFKQTVKLPTINDTSKLYKTDIMYVPCSLGQKITISSDKLMIAWAGDRESAKRIIKEVQTMHSEGALLYDINHYLDTIPCLQSNKVSLLGFLKEENGYARFCRNSFKICNGYLENLYAAGSGVSLLMDVLNSQQTKLEQVQKFNIFDKSIGMATNVVSTLLMNEFIAQGTLIDHFGAGYEIATLKDGKFTKYDDVSYLFWSAEVDSKGIRISQCPHECIRYTYYEDQTLGIRTISNNVNTGTVSKNTLHIVSPLFKEVDFSEAANFSLPDFDTTILCNCILVKLPNSKFANLTLIKSQAIRKFFKLNATSKGIEFFINKQLIEEMAKLISQNIKA